MLVTAVVWASSMLAGQAQEAAGSRGGVRLSRPGFDSKIERFVYGGDSRSGRDRLDSDEEYVISTIDSACQLTKEQKQKLHLAGRGDIKRFLGKLDLAKDAFWLRCKALLITN